MEEDTSNVIENEEDTSEQSGIVSVIDLTDDTSTDD